MCKIIYVINNTVDKKKCNVFHRTDEKEVGTEGKMLLLACDNGHLLGFALHGGEKVWGIYLWKTITFTMYSLLTSVLKFLKY